MRPRGEVATLPDMFGIDLPPALHCVALLAIMLLASSVQRGLGFGFGIVCLGLLPSLFAVT